jgi:hypothetical protein
MSLEEQKEQIRARLRMQADIADFEWNFTSEVVLVAKEMGVDTDDVMEWTIMKFNVIKQVIYEYYDKMNNTNTVSKPVTLG